MCAALLFAEALHLHCPKSDRIPWIQDGGIDVGNPWSSYTSPNDECCDVTDPGTYFDAQGKHTSKHIHVFA